MTALDAELAGIADALRAAAEAGEGDEYVRLRGRQGELTDRLKVARFVFARSGFALARAAHSEREQAGEGSIAHAELEGFRTALERATREIER